ncbi:MAG: triose-phosphate isomerase [Gemmatimonadota bacterium]
MTISAPLIAGNWKLNHGPAETTAFLRDFLPRLAQVQAERGTVVLFPPSISLPAAREAIGAREGVLLGVQNVYWESSGAFTGEVSAPIARDAGAKIALVGHSERRHLFDETDAHTRLKIRAVLDAGLSAILCVGETLDQRESGEAHAVVERQLEAVLPEIREDEVRRLYIAYEPVWAIGTGRTASSGDAAEMHGHIRSLLVGRFPGPSSDLPILYGGSVKPDNAAELLAASEVGGLLVGGASLDPSTFASICALGAVVDG